MHMLHGLDFPEGEGCAYAANPEAHHDEHSGPLGVALQAAGPFGGAQLQLQLPFRPGGPSP